MKHSPKAIKYMKELLAIPQTSDMEAQEALDNLCEYFKLLHEIDEREKVTRSSNKEVDYEKE